MSKSAVCHGLGGRHRHREVSSAFCALQSQIELPELHRRHFGGLPAALVQEALRKSSLQQDSAPSHVSMITQFWILIHSIISKEVRPARSPDLNARDFSIQSILETKTCSSLYATVEAFKAKLEKEWAAILQETIRAACASFSARLRAVVKNKVQHIESIFYLCESLYSNLLNPIQQFKFQELFF